VRKLAREMPPEEPRQYEQRHSMMSSEFYDRFRPGELDDAEELVTWAGVCQMALQQGLLRDRSDAT